MRFYCFLRIVLVISGIVFLDGCFGGFEPRSELEELSSPGNGQSQNEDMDDISLANEISESERQAELDILIDFFELPAADRLATEEEFAEFKAWADSYGITLVGIKKEIDKLYYNQFDPATDLVLTQDIVGIMAVYEGLKVLPDFILEVMREDVIYFETVPDERPYTIIAGNYYGTLKGLKNGIIVTIPFTGQMALHEFAHILGYHGIEGAYNQYYNIYFPQFNALKEEYDRIFDTSAVNYDPNAESSYPGYISVYSSGNKAENFAEHFAYYVSRGSFFRAKMNNDSVLTEKYNFFKDKIFRGQEY